MPTLPRRKEALPVHHNANHGTCAPVRDNTRQIVSGLAFCASSSAMILLNKAAMSTFRLTAPSCLVLFQCSVTPVLVLLWCTAGCAEMPRLDRKGFIRWLPVNFMFSGMIWTSFLALRHIGVATCTVLKNLTNFLVIAGDYYLFNKTYSAPVWGTLILMLLSAVCSGLTDIEYNFEGYMWQMVNNVFTAGYSLYLRWIMTILDAQREKVGSDKVIDEFGMVMYNNLLSIPMLAVLAGLSGEMGKVLRDPALYDLWFRALALVSSVVGFLISLSSMWFLSSTTATTFSLVGSLNKIPMAALGMLVFGAPVSVLNIISIAIGLLAGVLFVYAKAYHKGS